MTKHCGDHTCLDSRRNGGCLCSCDTCQTCACGCNEPNRSGFMSPEQGVWKGRGAGYKLVKRTLGWDVFDERGLDITLRTKRPRPISMDEAILLATQVARANGHGHP